MTIDLQVWSADVADTSDASIKEAEASNEALLSEALKMRGVDPSDGAFVHEVLKPAVDDIRYDEGAREAQVHTTWTRTGAVIDPPEPDLPGR